MHIYRQTHKKSGGHYLSSEPSARQKHMSFKLVQQTNLLLLPLLYTEVEWKSFLGIFFLPVILNLVWMKGEKNISYYLIIFYSSNPWSSFKAR